MAWMKDTASRAIASTELGVLPLGRTNAPIVEDNDPTPRGDAVDDPGIPPIEFRSKMIEEDDRHSRAWPELPVDEFRPVNIGASGGCISPHDARAMFATICACSYCSP